jgi:hypothetical protein
MARTKQVTRSERALVDALVDAYAAWREEAAAVERTYREWVAAAEGDNALAFTAYQTALDREEYAADRYAATVADFRCARRRGGRGG